MCVCVCMRARAHAWIVFSLEWTWHVVLMNVYTHSYDLSVHFFFPHCSRFYTCVGIYRFSSFETESLYHCHSMSLCCH